MWTQNSVNEKTDMSEKGHKSGRFVSLESMMANRHLDVPVTATHAPQDEQLYYSKIFMWYDVNTDICTGGIKGYTDC